MPKKGWKPTLETRLRWSKARKGRKRGPMSEAQKEKHRNKVFTKKHRRNLSLARKGKPLPETQRAALLGHEVSLETREKISKTLKERARKLKRKHRRVQRMEARPRPSRLRRGNIVKPRYVRTKEHSEKISKAKLGKSPSVRWKHSDQARGNMSKAQLKRNWKPTAEMLAKSAASRVGVPKTESWKQKVRESRARRRAAETTLAILALDDALILKPGKRQKFTRVKPSEETRANMRAAAFRRFQDPAEGEKIASALRGRTASTETRVKQSKAAKGKKKPPFTAEHRANLSRAASSRNLTNTSACVNIINATNT